MRIVRTEKYTVQVPGNIFELWVPEFSRMILVSNAPVVISVLSDIDLATDLVVNGKNIQDVSGNGIIKLIVKTTNEATLIVSFVR